MAVVLNISMKLLILRFSSFGDVTQCLSVPSKIKEKYPQVICHWAVREDLAELLQGHPAIHKVFPLSPKTGAVGLWKLGLELRRQGYTHLYDAHNNLRSHVLTWQIRFLRKIEFIRKSQKRWKRFLLFRLRINKYEQPFSGQRDLLEPLAPWGIDRSSPAPPQLFVDDLKLQLALRKLNQANISTKNFIALAPSAAFLLKRWPMENWVQLIEDFPLQKFVLLGGPNDYFLDLIAQKFPQRVLNLAGQCSLLESAAIVQLSKALVANDTGLLHVAEQLGHPAIALMGPAPFGFPSRSLTQILQLDLACRPCSKHGQGPCVNPRFQLCLRGITPEKVGQHLDGLI